jgi:gamma-glutamyltranspeptidase/glutathione hydrolase
MIASVTPRRLPQPDELLSGERARALAQRIDRRRAATLHQEVARHPDTTYLCVVDEARNVVSYIHSLYTGSGVVAGDTGILLNRMGCFTLDPNSPNRLAPAKRPMHIGMTVQAPIEAPRWTMGGQT